MGIRTVHTLQALPPANERLPMARTVFFFADVVIQLSRGPRLTSHNPRAIADQVAVCWRPSSPILTRPSILGLSKHVRTYPWQYRSDLLSLVDRLAALNTSRRVPAGTLETRTPSVCRGR
jgi:hypothetical protein